ncbi:hypothetical protein EG832_05545 [bacterium]|nr:hypothetical protein [bacterium]
MQFTIDGILQTLLVGAIASLTLLSFIFLFFGHVFRAGPLRHIFRFLMYESDAIGEDSSSEFGETYRVFVSLLLVATLFGAGVLAEAFSDVITSQHLISFMSDPEIKVDSFVSIAKKSIDGGFGDENFSRFVADYSACSKVSPDKNIAIDSPCSEMRGKIIAFYYAAKNSAFDDPNHFTELSKLQQNIDFTRSIGQIFFVLSLELFVAFVIAFISEAFAMRYTSKNEEPFHSYPIYIKPLMIHWLNLSAKRSIFLSSGFLIFSFLIMYTWQKTEEDFDKRVYGYFMADATLASANSKESSKPLLATSRILQSNYKMFQLGDAQNHFEPSSVGLFSDRRHVIVSNDKGGDSPLSIFSVKDGLLVKPFVLDTGHSKDSAGGILGIRKIESLNVSRVDKADIVTLSGTFESNIVGSKRIVQFGLEWTADNHPRIANVHLLELASDPCALLFKDSKEKGGCIIEGIATNDPEKELVLGVRYKMVGDQKIPRLGLIRLTRNRNTWVPNLILDESMPGKFYGYGLSDLTFLPDGRLAVLSSFESEEMGMGIPVTQTRGALWILSKDVLTKGGTDKVAQLKPSMLFAHKPEGIVNLENGNWLVVYDDDAKRKDKQNSPNTFPLSFNQSVYSIVRLKGI